VLSINVASIDADAVRQYIAAAAGVAAEAVSIISSGDSDF
jgi:hypothetical protein